MKKVIAIDDSGRQVLTTAATAEKNNWWVTWNVEVISTEQTICDAENIGKIPKVGMLVTGLGGRIYQYTAVSPLHICHKCKRTGKNRVGYKFYCDSDFKQLVVTKPIVRYQDKPNRNASCTCGSGKKYKHCCLAKDRHTARHYFNSEYKRGEQPKKTA